MQRWSQQRTLVSGFNSVLCMSVSFSLPFWNRLCALFELPTICNCSFDSAFQTLLALGASSVLLHASLLSNPLALIGQLTANGKIFGCFVGLVDWLFSHETHNLNYYIPVSINRATVVVCKAGCVRQQGDGPICPNSCNQGSDSRAVGTTRLVQPLAPARAYRPRLSLFKPARRTKTGR